MRTMVNLPTSAPSSGIMTAGDLLFIRARADVDAVTLPGIRNSLLDMLIAGIAATRPWSGITAAIRIIIVHPAGSRIVGEEKRPRREPWVRRRFRPLAGDPQAQHRGIDESRCSSLECSHRPPPEKRTARGYATDTREV